MIKTRGARAVEEGFIERSSQPRRTPMRHALLLAHLACGQYSTGPAASFGAPRNAAQLLNPAVHRGFLGLVAIDAITDASHVARTFCGMWRRARLHRHSDSARTGRVSPGDLSN